jgi:hypothetical protein
MMMVVMIGMQQPVSERKGEYGETLPLKEVPTLEMPCSIYCPPLLPQPLLVSLLACGF